MDRSPSVVVIPLLNPNEPEALLAVLHVNEGQRIAAGDLLCTLETTKSTADLNAPAGGYVVGLRFEQGQTVRAGEILCYLAETPEWTPPVPESQTQRNGPGAEVPDDLRITQPALALARENSLDLSRMPTGILITEKVVRAHLEQQASSQDFPPVESPFDPTAIVVYGGGGHGKMVIELLLALGTYRILGVIDDGRSTGQAILGLPFLGGAELLPELFAQGVRLAVNAVGGIGNISVRIKVFQRLAGAGFACPAIVHPTAYVEPSASLSPGVQVLAKAYVGSQARLGFGDIINTGAIISHDCNLGDYVNISPGAILAGEVQVGAGTLIGMGVTVNLQAKIGAGARIGNGATVKSDVPEKGVVRAGTIWPYKLGSNQT